VPRPVAPGDAGEEGVAGVAAAHSARVLGAVKRQDVGAEPLAPERLLELLAQPARLLFQRGRAWAARRLAR
jgi:hypothetical protein